MLGLNWTGTFLHAEHDVDHDQFEPGIPDDDQARRHVLDFAMMDWTVTALYGITNRVGVEFALPVRMNIARAAFKDAAGNNLSAFSSIHHRDETLVGIGDIQLGARFALLRRTRGSGWALALQGGLSIPTGNTEHNPFELGRQGRAHQHIFFGTGTVIPYVGFQASYAFRRLSLAAWAVAQPSLYDNSKGYRASTRVAGAIGVLSSFGLRRWGFLLSPEVFVETPAKWEGERAENSGRIDLMATAGVFFTPSSSWQLSLLVKVPYYRYVFGGQLNAPVLGLLGVTYLLDLFAPAHSH
ncbi:MAG: transporter [Myxococcales bacterium]|nr:transporter [Myxococcales bacterium]